MRGSEKAMRSNVVKLLRKAGLDARPVENAVDIGYPDIEYIGGLLELKQIDAWPKKIETPLRCEHYTQEQRIWHERRWHAGGAIYVLLQVGPEFLLFTGPTAANLLGFSSRKVLFEHCLAHYTSLADLSGHLPYFLKLPR